MIALYASVLGSSLVGSLHCAAMCGPLQGLYLDPRHASPGSRLGAPLAHAAGRLGAYAALGTMAGAAGAAVDLAGRAAQLQRAAVIIAGVVLIAWGALAIASALGVPVPSLHPRAFERGLVRIRRRKPAVRAALIGLLSAALPCGWLWAFVVVAAGTGSPLLGAAVMTTFWAGTVPMMVGLGVVAAPVIRKLGGRLPLVTAAALIAVGVIALATRVPMLHAAAAEAAPAASGAVPTAPACHGGS